VTAGNSLLPRYHPRRTPLRPRHPRSDRRDSSRIEYFTESFLDPGWSRRLGIGRSEL